MDNGHVFKPECLFRVGEESLEPAFGSKVESGDVGVAGVKAEADREVQVWRNEGSNGSEFFEVPAQLCARSSGIFEQDCKAGIPKQFGIDVAAGCDDGFRNVEDAVFGSEALVIAGVGDQVFGADQQGTFNFKLESLDRFFANDRGRRSKVDQITVVDDEGEDIVLVALGLQEFYLCRVRAFSAPHAGAGGENLQGIGSGCYRALCSAFE